MNSNVDSDKETLEPQNLPSINVIDVNDSIPPNPNDSIEFNNQSMDTVNQNLFINHKKVRNRKPSVVKDPERPFFTLYKKSFVHRKFVKNKNEILSGLTVALAQIPEAVAFSLIATVSPVVGLKAVVVLGIITSLFGGRPGMISGATGALAIVQKDVVIKYDEDFLFAIMIATGIIQMLIGLLQGGRLIRLIPESVEIGFLNGLAIIIAYSQLTTYKVVCDAKDPSECDFIKDIKLLYMILITLFSFLSIEFLPKIPKIGKHLPIPLLVMGAATIINYYILDTKTVGEVGKVSGGFPTLHIPSVDLDFDKTKTLIIKAIEFSLIGIIESLMTVQIVDEQIKNKGNLTAEAVAQGFGNFLCGWTGSLGGCTMIGQTQINIHHGGIKRLSSFVAATGVLLIMVAVPFLIEMIPVSALAGLMFFVVYKTFYWKSLRFYKRIKNFELFIIILVTILTVLTDLALAVIIGSIISGLHYAWEEGFSLHSYTQVDNPLDPKKKIYFFSGDLFYASVKNFRDRFHYKYDPKYIEVNCSQLRILDYTAVRALEKTQEDYHQIKYKIFFTKMDDKSFEIVKKSKLLKKGSYSKNQLINFK